MKIGKHNIGEGHKSFIIAELSANHDHDIQIAKDTIKAAKECGADAIKLQTYTPDTITIDSKNKYFQIDNDSLWDGKTLYDLYKEAYTPWEWHQELFDTAHKEGITCFSSPFDHTAVDLLEELDAPAYKIASFEIQDIPLIKYVAEKGKPIIMSTGIATLEDIELAVETCINAGNNDIALLKCTSSYPAPIDLANLNTIKDLKSRFDVVVGISDHTIGNTVPVVGTALGSKIIEKHFIIDKKIGGPDASFSLDPDDFRSMVNDVRLAEESMGSVTYELSEKVKKNRKFARSLFSVEDINPGDPITNQNVRSIRPGYGLHPKHLSTIIGKKANCKIERGTPMSFDYLED